jgi:predicted nucleotidyltransferase
MVAFDTDSSVSYFDWPDMQDELSEIFAGRRIDLVSRAGIRNPFIRHQVFSNRRVLFVA